MAVACDVADESPGRRHDRSQRGRNLRQARHGLQQRWRTGPSECVVHEPAENFYLVRSAPTVRARGVDVYEHELTRCVIKAAAPWSPLPTRPPWRLSGRRPTTPRRKRHRHDPAAQPSNTHHETSASTRSAGSHRYTHALAVMIGMQVGTPSPMLRRPSPWGG